MDLCKTRMQLSGENGQKLYSGSFDCFMKVVRGEGPLALYKGYTAAILRQVTYGMVRLGVNSNIIAAIKRRNGGKNTTFGQKILAGIAGGVCGAYVGNPAEVVLIRMTADGRLPPEQRRGYRNALQALWRIYKEEGLKTLWVGSVTCMCRACVITPVQLGCYAQAKEIIRDKYGLIKNDGIGLHAVCSLIAGFLCSLASLPLDIVKTRLQTATAGQYKGAFDCVLSTVKNEGVLSLWKGFTPYFLRVGPHTIFTLIFLEQINKYFGRYYMKMDC